MKVLDRKPNNRRLFPRFVLVALLCVAILGAAAWAWLSHERTVAGVAVIDSPRNIFITAAHKEDLIYLDLTDINLTDNTHTDSESGMRYKDYPFTVTGEGIIKFQIQLAYTTNNQFSFQIYNAHESDSTTDVEYFSNTTDKTYYYARDLKEELYYFNLDTETGKTLGDDDALISTDTYTPLNGPEHTKVNEYAYPIYCQTNRISADYHGNTNDTFYNYFILRVMWPSDRTNDGETDILYLSAAQA